MRLLEPGRPSLVLFLFFLFAALILLLAAPGSSARSQTAPQTTTPSGPDPHAVPSIDGGVGSCSADLTVTEPSGAPVYLAKVTVHIAYGFLNKHKLDLELSTNVDGRARITGLPDRIKHGFYFRAAQGDRSGEAFDDPENTCKAQFTIPLEKK